ncbi:TPA: hypothetical protein ACJL58_000367 [Neisseria meningitidis]|nr:hypothetical protein [Neisseria meningitidis]EOC12198.1 hypothetical protein NM73696_1194 [Neisseria meningitidis 73696]EJU58268.1 ydg [Neisseria meningitidis NM183]EJU59094.1 ydg [Neisseria meningitidis NM140]EJU60912.1 ydg [Neisseria meningitidis NM2781]EJU65305.1 ydg [Neisseria meningitidis NM576]
MEQLDLAAMAACDTPYLFRLGRVSMTATVDNWAKEHLPAQLYDNDLYAQILLEAHRHGIWGDIPPEDAKLNQLALKPGEEGRIMSSYKIGDQKIWVITEWDRRADSHLKCNFP